MIIDVDLTSVPPRISLREADDFKSFKLLAHGEHAFVDRETLLAMDGARAQDADWVAALDGMLAFAASKGWVNDDGETRAHIEHST